MANYTKIQLTQAREIFDRYGLGGPQQIRPFSTGISNTNYEVTTSSGKYLLKIANDKNAQQLEEELDIYQFLLDSDFAYSPRPILNRDKKRLFQWEKRNGVIYHYIEGGPGDMTPSALTQVGKALKQLHHLPIPQNSKLRGHQSVGHDFQYIADYVTNDLTCPLDFKQAFQVFFSCKVPYFKLKGSPTNSLIHGDLYIDNTLFLDQRLVGLIDFEQGGVGHPLFDLGIALSGCCLKNRALDLNLIQHFLTGYFTPEELQGLEDLEKEMIYQSILVGLLSISLWRIRRFKDGQLDPSKAESYRELLQRGLVFHHEVPQHKFNQIF